MCQAFLSLRSAACRPADASGVQLFPKQYGRLVFQWEPSSFPHNSSLWNPSAAEIVNVEHPSAWELVNVEHSSAAELVNVDPPSAGELVNVDRFSCGDS